MQLLDSWKGVKNPAGQEEHRRWAPRENEPGSQRRQAEAPVRSTKRPGSQSKQNEELPREYCAREQFVQDDEEAKENEPSGQISQAVAPLRENLPPGHVSQESASWY